MCTCKNLKDSEWSSRWSAKSSAEGRETLLHLPSSQVHFKEVPCRFKQGLQEVTATVGVPEGIPCRKTVRSEPKSMELVFYSVQQEVYLLFRITGLVQIPQPWCHQISRT